MKSIVPVLLLYIVSSAGAFHEHYERGNFKECAQQLSVSERTRQLNESELFFLAECSFQIGEFSKAAVYYDRLLKNNTGDTRRLVARLIDTYQNTADDSSMENVLRWFEHHPGDDYHLSRLRTLFFQNSNLSGFSRLYRLRPYRLDDQTWTRLFSQSETQVKQLIEISPTTVKEKEILFIRYLHARGDSVTAEKMLREHPDRHSREFRVVLFELLSAGNRKDEAIEELNALTQQEPAVALQAAELLFDKGYINEAIEQLQTAEEKGFFHIDRKIFYLTAAGRNRDALLELEQGRYAAKIPEYQYLQIRHEILRSWEAAEYVKVLGELTDKIPGSCRTLVELGSGYSSILNDERLLYELNHCNGLLVAPRRSTTLQMLFEKKRYVTVIRLIEQNSQTDRFELFLRLKAHYHIREYETARQIADLVLQDNSWSARSELRYYQGKISLAMRNYPEAASHFEELSFEDSSILYLEALHASRNWDKLAEAVNAARPPSPHEAKYYKAIWSLRNLQTRQASILLEEYLNDPGIHGVRAVHLLFILKYFSDEELSGTLAANLALFPDYLGNNDWNLLNPDIGAKPETEFEAYCLYWQARWLLTTDAHVEAFSVLANLKESPVAGYLQEEILYLIENSRNTNADFIRQFPSSPFRILGNP